MNLAKAERKRWSQNGEDGVIQALLRRICGNTIGVALELGYRQHENNTRALEERGWRTITVDARPEASIQDWVVAENVEAQAEHWGVPRDLDFLSIDLDGQDLWVMDALLTGGYRPRLICVEYNAAWGMRRSIVVPCHADWVWDRTNYMGASLLALARVAARHGYQLVYCDASGTNAFFVAEANHETDNKLQIRVARCYRPPAYRLHPHGDGAVVEITP